MARIFPEYKRSTVYALIGGVFHVVIVVIPFSFLMMSEDGYGGKLIEMYVYFVWFVLYLPFLFLFSTILQYFPQIGAPGTANNFIFFAIVGTLLYTLSGWFIGYLTEKYSQRDLPKTENCQDR